MENTTLLIIVLTLVPAFVFGLKWKDCGNPPTIQSVTISGCSGDFCILKRGTNASIEVDFGAAEATVHATSKVHGIIGGIPVSFPLPDSDGCHGMDPHCPLKKGTKEAYKTSLLVKPIFPKLKLIVKWEEVSDSGHDLFCLMFPAEIQ